MYHIAGFTPKWPWPRGIMGCLNSWLANTGMHTYTSRPQRGTGPIWPSAGHLWRMKHFASDQHYHKIQMGTWSGTRNLCCDGIRDKALRTKRWAGQRGRGVPPVSSETCYAVGTPEPALSPLETATFDRQLGQDWRGTRKCICSSSVRQ